MLRPASVFRENPLESLHSPHFLFEWLHTAMTTFLIFQTKDKMCDIIDTTYLYPFTTTIVAKTTSKSKEATAGGDTPSTSHPPTSVPTEGKVENTDLRTSPELSVKQLWRDVKWSAFAGTVLYWYWRVCSFARCTRRFSLFWRSICCKPPLKLKEIHSRWQARRKGGGARRSCCVCSRSKQCRLNKTNLKSKIDAPIQTCDHVVQLRRLATDLCTHKSFIPANVLFLMMDRLTHQKCCFLIIFRLMTKH